MTVSDESNKSSWLKDCKPENVVLDRSLSFKEILGAEVSTGKNELKHKPMPALAVSQPEFMFSSRPVKELNDAAVTLQKVYKSYRTRRNLADCAVVAEELWWRGTLDSAAGAKELWWKTLEKAKMTDFPQKTKAPAANKNNSEEDKHDEETSWSEQQHDEDNVKE